LGLSWPTFNVPFVLELFPDIEFVLEFIISSAGKEFRKYFLLPSPKEICGSS
jgi:hypothetical protein